MKKKKQFRFESLIDSKALNEQQLKLASPKSGSQPCDPCDCNCNHGCDNCDCRCN
jgi:hypothetical protein